MKIEAIGSFFSNLAGRPLPIFSGVSFLETTPKPI